MKIGTVNDSAMAPEALQRIIDDGAGHTILRPSVDVFFESFAEYRPIAQDEITSVVYGMPRAAVQMGAVTEQLGLGAIGSRIAQLATPRTKRSV